MGVMTVRRVYENRISLTAAGGLVMPTIAGVVGWYEADTGVTTSSGNITAVSNLANPGTNDLVNRGTVPFNATGNNGKQAFDYLAANDADLHTAATFAMGTSNLASVFFVGQMKAATVSFGGAIAYGVGATNDFSDGGNAVFALRDDTNNTIESYRGSGARGASSVSLATNYRVGTIYDGSVNTPYLNNVAGSTVATGDLGAGNFASPGTLVIGNRYSSGAVGGGAWEGPISAIVITNTVMTLSERNALDAYWLAKWGA